MPLVNCKECSAKVSTKAAACPNCGAKQRHTSGATKFIAWIVAILFVLYFIGKIISPADTKPQAATAPQIQNLVDQESGSKFIGMTKAELIEELGEPIKIITGSNPDDGNFEILTYDESDGQSTLFTIWADDKTVSSGQYKGKYFNKKQ